LEKRERKMYYSPSNAKKSKEEKRRDLGEGRPDVIMKVQIRLAVTIE